MKHVQKMVMIPEHLMQSIETEHRLMAPAQLTTLTHLDQDMKQNFTTLSLFTWKNVEILFMHYLVRKSIPLFKTSKSNYKKKTLFK